jgi:hypothetical protein
MSQLFFLIIPIPLVAFWFWMFRDMLNNDYLPDNPGAPLSWPPITRSGWIFAFIILNIFAAAWYYLVEYRNRHV